MKKYPKKDNAKVKKLKDKRREGRRQEKMDAAGRRRWERRRKRGECRNYSQLLHFSEEQGSAKINKTYYSRPVRAGRCSRKRTVKKQQQDVSNERKTMSAIGCLSYTDCIKSGIG